MDADDEDIEQYESFMNFMWQSYLDDLVEMLGTLEAVDELEASTFNLFEATICDGYREGLDAALAKAAAGQSLTRLGKRYRVNPGNVSRWAQGVQGIQYKSFAVVSAAENAKYLCGHDIALNAYEAAMRHVARVLGLPLADSLSRTEYFVTYCVFRHRGMSLSLFEENFNTPSTLSSIVNPWIGQKFPDVQLDSEELRRIATEHSLPWIVLWKALPDDWF